MVDNETDTSKAVSPIASGSSKAVSPVESGSSKAVSPMESSSHDSHPIILFDGVCNLCNAAVQWVIERDTQGRFLFASLQSEAARRELRSADEGVTIEALPDSIVLLDAGRIYIRSAAAIRIARQMGFPYALLGVFMAVPRPIRDAVYRLVAATVTDGLADAIHAWYQRRILSHVFSTPERLARRHSEITSARLDPQTSRQAV